MDTSTQLADFQQRTACRRFSSTDRSGTKEILRSASSTSAEKLWQTVGLVFVADLPAMMMPALFCQLSWAKHQHKTENAEWPYLRLLLSGAQFEQPQMTVVAQHDSDGSTDRGLLCTTNVYDFANSTLCTFCVEPNRFHIAIAVCFE